MKRRQRIPESERASEREREGESSRELTSPGCGYQGKCQETSMSMVCSVWTAQADQPAFPCAETVCASPPFLPHMILVEWTPGQQPGSL